MTFGRRVILTRPSSDSQAWLTGLQAAGYAVCNWPLIDIVPVNNTSRLQVLVPDWSQYQALMFVSRNAVTHAFNAGKPLSGAAGTRCWATGPGTRQALLDAGVALERIDAPAAHAGQFDTEALWQVVQAGLQTGIPVLILRGSEADQAETAAEGVGRDWLARQLSQAGVPVDTLAVYQRACPVWNDEQTAGARQAATDGSVWVFSSSQSIANLSRLLPKQDWSALTAIATHERIGKAAALAGAGRVLVCKPALEVLLVSLESMA
ncbi:MAG: uroporphyrinogen-III synthase [Limnohabitans sp.]|nr:uroporphyrinogen-III synthase [Limnohabitans sp.]